VHKNLLWIAQTSVMLVLLLHIMFKSLQFNNKMQLSSQFSVLALCANCYRIECYANHKYCSVLIVNILQIVVIVICSSICINNNNNNSSSSSSSSNSSSSIVVEKQLFFGGGGGWGRTDYINTLHSVSTYKHKG
jgi:uncharacterized membrane protein YgcG